MREQIESLPRPLLIALIGTLAAGALLFATRRGGTEEAVSPAAPAESQSGSQAQTPSQAGTQKAEAGKQGQAAPDEEKSQPRTLPTGVKNALDAHKVVAVMFYNPKSPDDLSVKGSVESISSHGGKVATFTDKFDNVARYTRLTGKAGVVTQTPTLIVVDPQGNGTITTGFRDQDAVDQLVVDALK